SAAFSAGTMVMCAAASALGPPGASPGWCQVAPAPPEHAAASTRPSPATAEPTRRNTADRAGPRMTILPDTSPGSTERVLRTASPTHPIALPGRANPLATSYNGAHKVVA